MHPGADESGPVPFKRRGRMMTRETHDRDGESTRGKEPKARRPHSPTHHGSHPRPSLSHRTFSHYSNLLHNLKTERPPRIPLPDLLLSGCGRFPGPQPAAAGRSTRWWSPSVDADSSLGAHRPLEPSSKVVDMASPLLPPQAQSVKHDGK